MADWYYLANNQPQGPFAEEALKELISTKALPRETLVWAQGMAEWVAASQVPAFVGAPSTARPPLPTAPVTIPAPSGPVRLEQKSFLHTHPVIEVINDHALRFESGRGKRRARTEVPLASLDPQFQRVKGWHVGSLALAALTSFFAAIVFLAGLFALFSPGTPNDAGVLLIFGVVMLALSGILIANALKKRRNALVFRSSSGAVVQLLFNNPDAATFDTFVSSLQARIEHARAQGSASVAAPIAQPKGCAQCGSAEIVSGFATPLCAPCRTALVHFPIPIWIKAAAVLLVIIMLSSALRIPREIAAAYHVERGGIDETKGDYKAAVADYAPALASYPKSSDVLADMARAAHRAGNQALALDCVDRIVAEAGPSGEVSKEIAAVVHEVRGDHP